MFLTFYSQFSTLYTKEPDMTRHFLPIFRQGKTRKKAGREAASLMPFLQSVHRLAPIPVPTAWVVPWASCAGKDTAVPLH